MAGNDTACTLLLHFNGTDGSTTIPDDSLVGTHGTASVFGTAQLDTAVKTFGTASLLLDGDSDYITFPDSSQFDFLTNPFTIDMRIRFTSIAGVQCLIGKGQGNTGNDWYLSWDGSSILFFDSYHSGRDLQFSAPFSPLVDTWYHIVLMRINTDNAATAWRIFTDGISQTLTLADGAWNAAIDAYSAVLRVGLVSTQYFRGYIDELRVSSIARDFGTGVGNNFTPPSAEYSEDTPTPPASTRRIFLIT